MKFTGLAYIEPFRTKDRIRPIKSQVILNGLTKAREEEG